MILKNAYTFVLIILCDFKKDTLHICMLSSNHSHMPTRLVRFGSQFSVCIYICVLNSRFSKFQDYPQILQIQNSRTRTPNRQAKWERKMAKTGGAQRPTITLPPRSSIETLFTGLSPGPLTLVSNFFSDNDNYPDSDCRSQMNGDGYQGFVLGPLSTISQLFVQDKSLFWWQVCQYNKYFFC